MKEFDFEQLVKRTVRQLKAELQRYKSQYSSEFRTIEDKAKQRPAELYQVRELLTTPKEYILIYHIEDTGLVHAVPLTEFVNLTTSNLRLYIKDLTLAPLPFHTYIVREALEKISRPIALVKPETTQKVIEDVEKTPNTSNIKPMNEFIQLVWKKYEQLTIASLLYNAIKIKQLDN
jgi:hypothetical protein